jgi:hypothetical protein
MALITSSGGVLTHLMNYPSPPDPSGQILPSDTWYFQCWYRDLSVPGFSTNTLDALQVSFAP